MGFSAFLPGWETVELIGSGGFSKVYKIRKIDNSSVGFYSALKVISVPSSLEEYNQYKDEGLDEKSIADIYRDQVKKIISEFEMMSSFKGTANIVSYEDHMILKKKDGKGYIILIRMELLETLTSHQNACPLDEGQVIKLGIDICRALRLCAEQNIVHRDIKPQNIFVNKFGDFKLGDFGIARVMDHATKATKIGTPSYISPEVYLGKSYDFRADVYSLGLVMYWLLNERRLPFMPLPPETPTISKTEAAFSTRISGAAIPPPKNGSAELKKIVLKACAYNPDERFMSAEDLEQSLEKLLFFLKTSKSGSGDAFLNGEMKKSSSADRFEKNNADVEGGYNGRGLNSSGTAEGVKDDTEKAPEADRGYSGLDADKEKNKKTDSAQKEKKKRPLLLSVALVIVFAFIGVIGAIALEEFGLIPSKGEDDISQNAGENSDVSEYVSQPAADDENEVAEDFSWSLNDGVLTISGKGKMPDYTTYAPWIERFSEIKTVVISNNITSVGNRAFYGCLALGEIVVSNNIKSIGNEAFAGCAALTSVTLHEGLETIGEKAFRDCLALKKINIPTTVKEIGKEAFYYCSSLENISIPHGVEKISERAFYYCTTFTEINIPETVKTIEGYAFYECTSLRKINDFSGVESIGEYAFYKNSALPEIILPETVSTVGDWAFAGCASLRKIKFPQKITKLAPFVLCASSALETVEFSPNVSQIDGGAFRGCTSLEKIAFSGTVSQWNGIIKDVNWDYNTPLYSVECIDGKLVKQKLESDEESSFATDDIPTAK